MVNCWKRMPGMGVNLRVTGHCSQGGRKYMEDMFSVAYQQTPDLKELEYAFFGIFDGHGGKEAAKYTKEHLIDNIVQQPGFWSREPNSIIQAVRDGFLQTHYAMYKLHELWPRTASGLPSTSGTTATVVFIRKQTLIVGHVGDSALVLGTQTEEGKEWKAARLTTDHKPECRTELERIRECGGKVVRKSGVPRVVWNRPSIGHKGPIRRSTPIDEIPFLAVARSLGDFWSYNSACDKFIVSPEPEVYISNLNVDTFRCLVLGTDGLWNVLSPQDAVSLIESVEKHNQHQLALALPEQKFSHYTEGWKNPSKCLVQRALERWEVSKQRADNTSVVTILFDPPGPPVFTHRSQTSIPQCELSAMKRTENAVTEEKEYRTIKTRIVKTSSKVHSSTSGSSKGGVAIFTRYPVFKTSCSRDSIAVSDEISETCKSEIYQGRCEKSATTRSVDIRSRKSRSMLMQSVNSDENVTLAEVVSCKTEICATTSRSVRNEACAVGKTASDLGDVQINEISSTNNEDLTTETVLPATKRRIATISLSRSDIQQKRKLRRSYRTYSGSNEVENLLSHASSGPLALTSSSKSSTSTGVIKKRRKVSSERKQSSPCRENRSSMTLRSDTPFRSLRSRKVVLSSASLKTPLNDRNTVSNLKRSATAPSYVKKEKGLPMWQSYPLKRVLRSSSNTPTPHTRSTHR